LASRRQLPDKRRATRCANGCKAVFTKAPGIKILSDDQDATGSREGGRNVTQGYLTRFPKIDAVFTLNDPQAVGTDGPAKQLSRTGVVQFG
jgi:ribose transport system substrate-binding protein